MEKAELKSLFDQQAASYDQQWARMSPLRDGLHLLLNAVFADLPAGARVLCVGAGTGVEVASLARAFPAWRFTAVDPSGPMLEVCRRRAHAEGFAARCEFHEGYLDSLPATEPYDGATCFLVSQFFLDPAARRAFFAEIAHRLRPGGVLASSDLAADDGSGVYEALLRVWLHTMSSAGVASELVERARAAYAKDVAILPPHTIVSLLTAAGFENPVSFFQAGLLHAWFCRRATSAEG